MAHYIEHMPAADYHAHTALSKGKLWPMLKSPLHFRYNLTADSGPQTPAMRLGSICHKATLEPDTFQDDYLVNDFSAPPQVNRRNKEGKAIYAEWQANQNAWLAAHPGTELITVDEFATATEMARAVRNHPTLEHILDDPAGMAELSIFWEDQDTGIECKARVDYWHPKLNVAVDLKTAADASRGPFAAASARYGYHLQDAHYMAGLRQVFRLDHSSPMLFVVVENKPPHAIALYTFDDEARTHAENLRLRLMQQVDECASADEWPGYSERVQPLSLPRWSLMQEETL